MDCLTMLPLGVLAVMSQNIVDFLFDHRCESAGWMLQALCIRAAMVCILAPVETYLVSVGSTKYGFYRDLARSVWVLVGIPLGWAWWGLSGVVWVVALSELPVAAVLWVGFFRLGCMRPPQGIDRTFGLLSRSFGWDGRAPIHAVVREMSARLGAPHLRFEKHCL